MEDLYLCGAGNPEAVRLALRINRLSSTWDRIQVLDDLDRNQGRSILGVPVTGRFDDLSRVDCSRARVANLVSGSTGRRRAARHRIESFGIPFVPLIDPGVDTDGVGHADDALVFQNAVLGAGAVLGRGSVISMGAVVGHESALGEDCVVAPNAVLNGRSRLGEGVFVGANAAILPDVCVGDWATIGGCSLVVRDVGEGVTVMGVPARAVIARPAAPRAAGASSTERVWGAPSR